MKNRFMRLAAFVLVQLGFTGAAFAGGGGGGLPWEAPLQTLANSLTGPVALGISIIAMAAACGTLIFGGELNDFARRLMYVVLVAGILLGATQIVGLFGASGASIGTVETVQSTLARKGGAGEGRDG